MDLRYVREQSFLLDMRLLFRTVGAVLSSRGAY
jgi:lipopolysaccharide/colanic/teichoic acid biosynthesis glycosyltransferase